MLDIVPGSFDDGLGVNGSVTSLEKVVQSQATGS